MLMIKKMKVTTETVNRTLLGEFGVNSDFGLPIGTYTPLLSSILSSVMNSYKDIGYHFLPLGDDETISDELYYRAIQMRMNCKIRDLMFPVLTKITDLYNFDIPFEDGVRDSEHRTSTTTYGKVTTEEKSKESTDDRTTNTSSSDFDINENSPINATMTITTPNFKVKSDASSEQTNTNYFEGTENNSERESGSDTVSDTFSATHSKSSPYYMEKYFDIVKKYNFYNLAEQCIRSVIHEYNFAL